MFQNVRLFKGIPGFQGGVGQTGRKGNRGQKGFQGPPGTVNLKNYYDFIKETLRELLPCPNGKHSPISNARKIHLILALDLKPTRTKLKRVNQQIVKMIEVRLKFTIKNDK